MSLQLSIQTSFDILSGVGSGQFLLPCTGVQAADSGFQVYVYAPRNLVRKQVCFRSLFMCEIEVQYIGDSRQSVRIIHYQLFLFRLRMTFHFPILKNEFTSPWNSVAIITTMSFGKIDFAEFAPKRECFAIKTARDLLSIIIIDNNYQVGYAFVRHLYMCSQPTWQYCAEVVLIVIMIHFSFFCWMPSYWLSLICKTHIWLLGDGRYGLVADNQGMELRSVTPSIAADVWWKAGRGGWGRGVISGLAPHVASPVYIANMLKSLKASPCMTTVNWHSRVTQTPSHRYQKRQLPTEKYVEFACGDYPPDSATAFHAEASPEFGRGRGTNHQGSRGYARAWTQFEGNGA